MITQTTVFTPGSSMSITEALARIADLLPAEVINFLAQSAANGARNTSTTESNGTFTMVTEWSEDAAQEYKTLMSTVSDGVTAQLQSEGWTITFTPETADL